MKPHHAILLGFAIGIGITALVAICLREPCPSTATSTTTQGMLDRASQRDSIDIASEIRSQKLDTIKAIIKNPDHDKSRSIVGSRSDQQWLDSLRSKRP
jgi:hypothetical protein